MDIKGNNVNKSVGFQTSTELKQSDKNVKTNEKSMSNESNDTVNEEELKKAVEKVNNFLEDNVHIEYEKHDKFNTMIVKLVNNDTKEVIREIPSKKILDMVAKMCELAGVLIDKKA